MFSLPGSTRSDRRRISQAGFSTKAAATDAEARRRIEEHHKCELAKQGAETARVPTSLASLFEEFFTQHVDMKLAPKTIEWYHEHKQYLDPALLSMELPAITPLILSREWIRLLERGGHHRRTHEPRPLSRKTVQNIAGVVSSAFKRAIKWGLVSTNPVAASEPPIPKKRRGMALTPDQTRTLIAAATSPWCLGIFLDVCAATGARRGEVLALRWSDIQNGRLIIGRSLSQTKQALSFKGTKTDSSERLVSLPASTVQKLEVHRAMQNQFRTQFGEDYRHDLDLLFAQVDGTPLKPDSVSASVSALFKRLKFPTGASLHTLRHTHGSQLIAAGMELSVVSERLGHSNSRVTAEVYTHAIHGRDDEAARRWDEFQNPLANRPGGLQ
ncbi:MAG: site-specific integrase [Acidobacteriota bacterium]